MTCKLIMGLGNPGPLYYFQRHSIGFRVLDALAQKHELNWHSKKEYLQAELKTVHGVVFLIKPLTYMNSSGSVLPFFTKKGIVAENVCVVHDELELPFGKIAEKKGGSHKGHNGLKSIMSYIGPDFYRIRVGIARPSNKEDVPAYVLQPFSEPETAVDGLIDTAVRLIEQQLGL